jgi:hypothetical protein
MTIDIITLYDLLVLRTHEQVMAYIKSKVDVTRWIVLESDLYSVFMPRNIKDRKPALCAHTDVVQQVRRRNDLGIKKQILFNKQKNTGLGADDRAGIYVLLKTMISNPDDFIFCFFDLEESAGQGSQSFGGECIQNHTSLWVGFDRNGDSDIATYNYDNKDLIKSIDNNLFPGYESAMGSFTDVATLAQNTQIACINFSVGFYKEHTSGETLSLVGLNKVFSVIPILRTITDKKEVNMVGSYLDPHDYPHSLYGRYSYGAKRATEMYYCPDCATFHWEQDVMENNENGDYVMCPNCYCFLEKEEICDE